MTGATRLERRHPCLQRRRFGGVKRLLHRALTGAVRVEATLMQARMPAHQEFASKRRSRRQGCLRSRSSSRSDAHAGKDACASVTRRSVHHVKKECPPQMLIKKFVVFIFLLTFTTVLSFAQTTWTPELQVKTKLIGTPRISPDGTRITYTVNEAVMTADKSEFVTQVWMATTDGKDNYQITFN